MLAAIKRVFHLFWIVIGMAMISFFAVGIYIGIDDPRFEALLEKAITAIFLSVIIGLIGATIYLIKFLMRNFRSRIVVTSNVKKLGNTIVPIVDGLRQPYRVALGATVITSLITIFAASVWVMRIDNAGEIYGTLTFGQKKCGGFIEDEAERQLLSYREGFPSRFDRAADTGLLRAEKASRVYFLKFCQMIIEPYASKTETAGFLMPTITGAVWNDGHQPASSMVPEPTQNSDRANIFDKFDNDPPVITLPSPSSESADFSHIEMVKPQHSFDQHDN